MSGLSFVWILRHFSGDTSFPFRSFLIPFFPRNHQYDLYFWWLAWELSHHAQSILNKYAPLFPACSSVFPRDLLKDLLDRFGEMSMILTFDIWNVYEIVAYDWLYSQYWGWVKIVDMVSKFLGSIEDCRLFIVCFGSVKRQN